MRPFYEARKISSFPVLNLKFVRIKQFLIHNKGLLFGGITLLFLLLFSLFPKVCDVIYAQIIYSLFRVIWDYSIALLPFALIYLVCILIPFLFFYNLRRRKCFGMLKLLNFLGWIFTAFFWMWGFHYCRTATFIRNDSVSPTIEQWVDYGNDVARETNQLRSEISIFDFEELSMVSDSIRNSVSLELQSRDWTTAGRPRVMELRPDGWMRRAGVAGIYLPFTGEAHCDHSYPPVVKGYIMAHELAHAFGVASEADADYIAYYALCRLGNSKEQRIASYAAQLELLRSIRNQLRLMNDSLRIQLDSTLSDQVNSDIRLIKENALLYPEFFSGLQESLNDKYLKALGQREGTRSYDRFAEMIWNDRMKD